MRKTARGFVAVLARFAALALCAALAHGQVVDVRQGTNLAIAYDPGSETLALDLLGGLWRLPATGGGATALIPAGSGIAQPRFDRSGRRVVFQRWLDEQWDVWLLDLVTGSWIPLTETPYNEREPEFSADGRRVVFASDRGGRYALWELDLSSRALRQLTDEPGDSRFPTFGGDGGFTYVNRRRDGSSLRRYAGGPSGSEIYRSTTTLDAPSVRPGGRVVIFNDRIGGRQSDLRLLIDADEKVVVPLTDNEDVFAGRVAWLSEAEYIYAADGQLWRRRIASKQREPVHLFAGASINLAEPEAVTARLDAAGPFPARGIAGWQESADGARIAFAALGDIWLAHRRSVERLTDDTYLDIQPVFAAADESLVFVSDRGGKMDLWRLELESGALRGLTSEKGAVFEPAAAPTGTAIAFLSIDGLGPWDRTALKRVQLDRPHVTETLLEDLYDARDLAWHGDVLRLSARRGRADAPLEEIALPAPAGGGTGAPAPGGGRPELPEAEALRWRPAAAEAPFVVQVGRLFDGIGNDYARHMDIHVEGQRIKAIVRRDLLPLPERVIDARDKTVLPGLIDVHVHESAAAGGGLGRLWLRNGVTTVREVDTELEPAVERAEAWASGRRLGPRLVVVPRTPAPDTYRPGEPVVLQSGDAISRGFAHAAAGRLLRAGLPPTKLPTLLHSGEAPELALSPLNLSYQDTIGSLLASGRFVATGLAASRHLLTGDAASADSRIPAFKDTLGRLMRGTGRIAVGSDAPAVPYGVGFHEELAALAEAGIPPAQILRWATAGGAMALGLDQQLGTLEPGKLADFVIVDGDPLARIGDLRELDTVVRGGVVLDRDVLSTNPAGVADR